VAPTTRAFLADLVRRESVGDLSYTAPESEPGTPTDERALVYSVGVLLIEGLTGRHPLGAIEGPRRLGRISSDGIAAIVAQSPEIPAPLRGVLERATCADPRTRFPSVAVLRLELEWFMVTEQEARVPPPMPPRRAPEVTVPAVVIAPHALVPSRPRSVEMELETALVPRLSVDDLMPRKTLIPKLRRPEPLMIERPRRSRPRRNRRRELLRMAAIAIVLMCGSAALTAGAMYLLQR
jgi:hypothetical protein